MTTRQAQYIKRNLGRLIPSGVLCEESFEALQTLIANDYANSKAGIVKKALIEAASSLKGASCTTTSTKQN